MTIRKTARSTEKIQAPFLFCNMFYDNHEIFVSGHVGTGH